MCVDAQHQILRIAQCRERDRDRDRKKRSFDPDSSVRHVPIPLIYRIAEIAETDQEFRQLCKQSPVALSEDIDGCCGLFADGPRKSDRDGDIVLTSRNA